MRWPGLAVPASNPYIGPRLLELVWFFACLLGAALLARTLVPAAKIFWLALLLAGSFSRMSNWVMQLRGDFPGIACSLLAIYFLLSKHRFAIIWAGILAGFAIQFKITFAAAALAGGLWLLLYKRWSHLLVFAATTGICSVGLYALFAAREPEMFRNILMLGKVLPHLPGVFVFIGQLLREPVFLLGAATLAAMLGTLLTRRRPGWQLLAIYLVVSLAIAIPTSLQAGASINYFYESMFAATPFAALGAIRLRAGRIPGSDIFLGLLLATIFVLPQAASAFRGARQAAGQVASRNREYEKLRGALAGASLLSSLPDVTMLGQPRIITDSILLNYRVLTTGADLSGLQQRIRDQQFDTIVTLPADYLWRGVPMLPRPLLHSVADAYRPYCLLGNKLFHLPSGRREEVLQERLKSIGCIETICHGDANCPGLGVQVDAFDPAR